MWKFKLLATLATLVTSAREQAQAARAMGIIPDERAIAAYLEGLDFDPQLNGQSLIDAETRGHFAKGIARLAIRLVMLEEPTKEAPCTTVA